MNLDKLDKISGVLGGAIALITLIISVFTQPRSDAIYILFVLSGLLILVWIAWVTRRLLSKESINHETRIESGDKEFNHLRGPNLNVSTESIRSNAVAHDQETIYFNPHE